MNKLYTYGYSGGSIEGLRKFVQKNRAVLADVRYKPYSRFTPQWGQKSLLQTFGVRYTHLLSLGNINYKGQFGDAIQFVDWNKGLQELKDILETNPVVLLCVCKDLRICHRLEIAEKAQQALGVEVVHLDKLMRHAIVPPIQMLLF